MTSGTVQVGLLRHRAAGDPLAARVQLERQLAAADISPRGLPPAAVLCVRRIRDPVPLSVRIDPRAVAPPDRWQRAVSERLEDALRTAARPALGPVAPDSGAVLFADESELLACLAADWLDGLVAERWWWRGLAIRAPVRDTVVRRFESGVRALPPAVAMLAAWGRLADLGDALTRTEAASLAAALAAEHHLPALRAAVDTLIDATGAPALSRGDPVSRTEAESAPAPWREADPVGAVSTADPVAALFVGVSLALARTPSRARSAAFAGDLAAWTTASLAPVRLAAAAGEQVTPTPPRPARVASHEVVAGGKSLRPAPTSETSTSRRPSKPRPIASAPAAPRAAPADSLSLLVDAAPVAPAPEPALEGASSPAAAKLEAGVSASLVVQTQLGGVLFLLNVAQFLGLYGDFTQPLDPGIGLDPWRFVAALGRDLLAGAGDADRFDDPLWGTLDALAGPDAAEWEPPGEWRLPPAWLEPFARADTGEPWTWSASRGRLTMRHPAGFTVIDVALDTRSPRRRAAALAHGHRTVRRAHAESRDRRRARRTAAFDRWIGWVASYALARLTLALVCDPGELAPVLLAIPARLECTATAVDATFELADLPIAVRLAGLDRDPGWIPAARRSVRFLFR